MPTVNGITCPNCRGVRLHVTHTVKAAPDLVVRYRKCVECRTRTKSQESSVQFRPRKQKV